MKQPSLPREQTASPSQVRQPNRKAYQPPTLMGYGSLIDFTRASIRGLRPDRVAGGRASR